MSVARADFMTVGELKQILKDIPDELPIGNLNPNDQSNSMYGQCHPIMARCATVQRNSWEGGGIRFLLISNVGRR